MIDPSGPQLFDPLFGINYNVTSRSDVVELAMAILTPGVPASLFHDGSSGGNMGRNLLLLRENDNGSQVGQEKDETTTNGGDSEGSHPLALAMPWPQRSSWIVVFALMLLVAIVGNALVAWIVLAHRRMKTVTNYFLVNLSVADLTMSLFNCIFNFTFMLNNHWPFGYVYCKANNFIANVTVAASVFTLVAISFDRYIAIVYPLRPRMSKSVARLAIALIWLSSFALAAPCLLYSEIISQSLPNGETLVACLMIWPDGLPNVSRSDFIYNIVFTVLTYLIPVAVMGVCYTRMSFVLWRSESIGELNQRQAESIKTKRKVVRMFIVVVTLFAVCWFPYHGYFVYQYIDSEVNSYRYVQHVFLGFYWLAMSNAMINPLVYYYMNPRFREYFRTILYRCLLCRCLGRSPSSTSEAATDLGGGPTTALHHHNRCHQLNFTGNGNTITSVDGRFARPSITGPGGIRRQQSRLPSSIGHHEDLREQIVGGGRRHRIIRFTTRRMLIFQRMSNEQQLQQTSGAGVSIPLVHCASLPSRRSGANGHRQFSPCDGETNGDLPIRGSPSPPTAATYVTAYTYV